MIRAIVGVVAHEVEIDMKVPLGLLPAVTLTGAPRQQLWPTVTTAAKSGVMVQIDAASTGIVTIGGPDATTGDSIQLAGGAGSTTGDSYVFPVANPAQLWACGAAGIIVRGQVQ